MTGFDVAPDDLRRRAEQVGRVEQTLHSAVESAGTASSPAAFGLLCSFFPGMLVPAQQGARDALDRGAAAVRSVGDALHDTAAAYTQGDAAAATSLRTAVPRGP